MIEHWTFRRNSFKLIKLSNSSYLDYAYMRAYLLYLTRSNIGLYVWISSKDTSWNLHKREIHLTVWERRNKIRVFSLEHFASSERRLKSLSRDGKTDFASSGLKEMNNRLVILYLLLLICTKLEGPVLVALGLSYQRRIWRLDFRTILKYTTTNW
jgi:hypothetical protein